MSYIYDLTDTWNNGATVYTSVKLNVTDTASDAASLLVDLQVGGTSKFKVSKSGTATFGGAGADWTLDGNTSAGDFAIGRPGNLTLSLDWNGQFKLSAGLALCWTATGNALQTVDTKVTRTAPGSISVGNASGAAGTFCTAATTVSGLPSAATVGAGARGFVTDATATTFLSTVTGGGANKVPVYSDGTNWKIG